MSLYKFYRLFNKPFFRVGIIAFFGFSPEIGFIIVGLSEHGKVSISKFNESSPIVLVVGSEDRGISLLAQKKCDLLLKIPLKGKTSSLNASVAAAISLFHLTNK